MKYYNKKSFVKTGKNQTKMEALEQTLEKKLASFCLLVLKVFAS